MNYIEYLEILFYQSCIVLKFDKSRFNSQNVYSNILLSSRSIREDSSDSGDGGKTNKKKEPADSDDEPDERKTAVLHQTGLF